MSEKYDTIFVTDAQRYAIETYSLSTGMYTGRLLADGTKPIYVWTTASICVSPDEEFLLVPVTIGPLDAPGEKERVLQIRISDKRVVRTFPDLGMSSFLFVDCNTKFLVVGGNNARPFTVFSWETGLQVDVGEKDWSCFPKPRCLRLLQDGTGVAFLNHNDSEVVTEAFFHAKPRTVVEFAEAPKMTETEAEFGIGARQVGFGLVQLPFDAPGQLKFLVAEASDRKLVEVDVAMAPSGHDKVQTWEAPPDSGPHIPVIGDEVDPLATMFWLDHFHTGHMVVTKSRLLVMRSGPLIRVCKL